MATEIKVTKKMLKKKVRITPYAIVCGIVLLCYSFVLLYPLLYGVMNSFKPLMQWEIDPTGLPNFSLFSEYAPEYMLKDAQGNLIVSSQIKHVFANYAIVLESLSYDTTTIYYSGLFEKTQVTGGFIYKAPQDGPGIVLLLLFLVNTVWTAVASTLVPVFWCAALGYACAKYKYKFVGVIYGIVIFRISCPIVGGGSAMLAMQRAFGFYDNIFGYFLFNSGSLSMYFLIMYAYFQGLPDSYMEAAEIDGATQLRILFTIAIPLAGTVMSASLVVSIITAWNDYNTPLLYLPSYPTIAYGIFKFKKDNPTFARGPFSTATSMLLAVPAFIFFISFRKRLMGNLSVGGIKG